MKLFSFALVLAAATTPVLGQTIEIGYPTEGDVLYPGNHFTAQIIKPVCRKPLSATR